MTDATGELYVNVFNQQAHEMLGASADELAALKDAGRDDELRAVLKGAQWRSWLMAVSSRSREYQGERKMRYTANSVAPLDYGAENARLVAAIAQLGG